MSRYIEEIKEGKKAIVALLSLLERSVDLSSIDKIFKEAMSMSGLKGRRFYHPVRIAITGYDSGPELIELIPILGKERCIERLQNALNYVEGKNEVL